MFRLSLASHRRIFSLVLLPFVQAAPARCQTLVNPPSTDTETSPSSPQIKKGSATEVPATEDEDDSGALAINLEIDTRSRYVFRGLAYSEGLVVQPTLSLAKHGTTFSLFGNLNASGSNGMLQGLRQVSEIDYSLTKSFGKGRTTIEPGIVYYSYPTHTSDGTGELSLNLSCQVNKVKLFFNNNLDVLEYDGAYFGELGVSHERALGPRMTGEATLSLSFANSKFNQANIGPRKSALNVLSSGASLTYQVNEKLYLRPHLNYTHILDSDLRDALEDSSVLEGSIALGFDF